MPSRCSVMFEMYTALWLKVALLCGEGKKPCSTIGRSVGAHYVLRKNRRHPLWMALIPLENITPWHASHILFSESLRVGESALVPTVNASMLLFIGNTQFVLSSKSARRKSFYNSQGTHWIRCKSFDSESRGCWFKSRWQHFLLFFFHFFWHFFVAWVQP